MSPSTDHGPDQGNFDRVLTPKVERKLELMRHQIEVTGGSVTEDLFVPQPGVRLIAEIAPNEVGQSVIDRMRIDPKLSSAEQLAELFSRQTYFTFSSQIGDGAALLDRVIRKAGHRSVTKSDSPVHLFAGISVAAAIDIVRAGGSIGRLTTSNTGHTRATNETFYRTYGEERDLAWQEEALKRFVELRSQIEQEFDPRSRSENGDEFFNMFNLQSKTLALLQSMNLKGLHSTFCSWLGSDDTSTEIAELGARMVEELSATNPNIIYTSDWYHVRSAPGNNNTEVCESYRGLQRLIEKDGGEIQEGLFVVKPGCAISWPSQVILRQLKTDEPSIDPRLVVVEFRLSGIAFETIMELLSHSEATVSSFLPFSQTRPGTPLYRIQGGTADQEWQREAVRRFQELRSSTAESMTSTFHSEPASLASQYAFERFDLGSRAEMLNYGMRLSDFHKLFIGRLSDFGNEQEIQELARMMCEQLHDLFPSHIMKPEDYYSVGNDIKY